MSIMDFFRGTDSASQQQQQEPTVSAPTNQQDTQVSNSGNSGEEPTGDVSSLDAFKDIWQTEPAKEGEDDPEAPFDPSSSLNVDPKAIQEAVGQMNFSQVLDSATLAKIGEGGEAAQQAFSDSLNKVSQYVFSQSMIANATLVKQALANSTEAFDSRAERMYKQSKITDTVTSANPVFKHPAAQPMVQALQDQLSRKYPQASPEEIRDKATQMFGSFAEEFSKPERDSQNAKSKGEDWEAFFNS